MSLTSIRRRWFTRLLAAVVVMMMIHTSRVS